MFKSLVAALGALALFAATPAFADSPGVDDGVHRLALQISDDNPQKMNTVLNVAANVSRYYSEKGELVDIEIVAFNAGLHMLREDTSPVLDRLKSFSEGMPNVAFKACGNTLESMTKKEGKKPPIIAAAEVVPAGVIKLMELDQQGYTVVRP